jgi:putative oxidoreductase
MKLLHAILDTSATIPPLVLRLVLGVVFFPHGAQKVLGWFGGHGFSGTMGFFTGMLHIPPENSYLPNTAELARSNALNDGF